MEIEIQEVKIEMKIDRGIKINQNKGKIKYGWR